MTPEQLCQEIKKAHESGDSYAKIAERYHMSKPAVGRIIKGEKPKSRTCEKMNLEPSAKILRDRERRKEQKNEIMRLRAENVIIKAALMAHLQADCKCPFCSGARKALANL